MTAPKDFTTDPEFTPYQEIMRLLCDRGPHNPTSKLGKTFTQDQVVASINVNCVLFKDGDTVNAYPFAHMNGASPLGMRLYETDQYDHHAGLIMMMAGILIQADRFIDHIAEKINRANPQLTPDQAKDAATEMIQNAMSELSGAVETGIERQMKIKNPDAEGPKS